MSKSAIQSARGMRWGIYTRISSNKGSRHDEDGDTISLETQEAGCRELIKRIDPEGVIQEHIVFREVWTGIELFSRPKLTQLREAIRRGEVDAIACYQPKRWTRDEDHAGFLKTELREHRVVLRYVLNDHGDGEAANLANYLEHWTGRKEHKDITERTHRARSTMVHHGKAWVGCKAPYGLRWSYRSVTGPGGRQSMEHVGWEEDPYEGPIVRGLFRDALTGVSLRSLAQGLATRGIPSPKGRGGWSHVTVRHILTQPVYTGEAAGLRYQTDESETYVGIRGASKGRNKKRQILKPREEWVALPEGYAPTLVDRQTWDAVQRVLSNPGESHRLGRRQKNPTLTFMAGGRARCADCGAAMTLLSKKSPAFMCSRRAYWQGCATRPYIRATELDGAVQKLARLIYEHPEVIAEQAALHREQDPTTADLEMVERTLLDIERRIQGLMTVAQNVTTNEAAALLGMQLESLADQKQRAQNERKSLLERRAGWEAAQCFLDDFSGQCARVSRRLDSFTHAEWQQAIDALGITAIVSRAPAPDHLRLTTRLEGLLTAGLIETLTAGVPEVGCSLYRTVDS